MEKEIITIQVNYKPKRVLLSDYVTAKTKSLIEFGYTDLKEETVEASVRSILKKEKQEDVIGMMCEGDIVIE